MPKRHVFDVPCDSLGEIEFYPEVGGEVVGVSRSGRPIKRPRRLVVVNECDDEEMPTVSVNDVVIYNNTSHITLNAGKEEDEEDEEEEDENEEEEEEVGSLCEFIVDDEDGDDDDKSDSNNLLEEEDEEEEDDDYDEEVDGSEDSGENSSETGEDD